MHNSHFKSNYTITNNKEMKFVPPLDQDFYPAVVFNHAYHKMVERSQEAQPLKIAVEREDGRVSVFDTQVLALNSGHDDLTKLYVERLIKSILWIRGGWKIIISGPEQLCRYVREQYSATGKRAFDAEFMSKIYEKRFEVEFRQMKDMPYIQETPMQIGRNFNGCRIGIDLGGSDRKAAAVIDGHVVYTEEVEWQPKLSRDPSYQYKGILDSLKSAASKLPKVEGIGVSAAGIYQHNRVMAASLFIGIDKDAFEREVKEILIKAAGEIGQVPLVVANDGDVTALAGSVEIGDNGVLGIAMGTSEAGGYVDHSGYITGWLNELAFVPIDFRPESPVDEWSGDYGCGVKYFSQDAVIRLAEKAGIELNKTWTPAQKLKSVQDLLGQGDERAAAIFETIGIYLGYTLAYYSSFYDIRHVLILGRVTSGLGGHIILETCSNVLEHEFPDFFRSIRLHLPDEANRRTGQAVAAASLPVV